MHRQRNHRKSHKFFMKFFIASILFVLTLTALGLSTTETHAQERRFGVVTAETNLRIRSGPGVAYEIIGALEPGANVEILVTDSTGEWYQVDNPGVTEESWTSALYIQELDILLADTAAYL